MKKKLLPYLKRFIGTSLYRLTVSFYQRLKFRSLIAAFYSIIDCSAPTDALSLPLPSSTFLSLFLSIYLPTSFSFLSRVFPRTVVQRSTSRVPAAVKPNYTRSWLEKPRAARPRHPRIMRIAFEGDPGFQSGPLIVTDLRPPPPPLPAPTRIPRTIMRGDSPLCRCTPTYKCLPTEGEGNRLALRADWNCQCYTGRRQEEGWRVEETCLERRS